MEFERITFAISSKPLKNIAKRAKHKVVATLLSQLGLRKHATLFSLIGNSMVELYVPACVANVVRDGLTSAKLTPSSRNPWETPSFLAEKDYTPAIVNRLALLHCRARFVKLREAILLGASEEQARMVTERADSFSRRGQQQAPNSLNVNAFIPEPTPVEAEVMEVDTSADDAAVEISESLQ
jgi:hypothetical protein